MNPKWKKPRATKSKTVAKKVPAAPKTKSAQVALIKKVVAGLDETKFRSELVVDNQPTNSQISFADAFSCLPKLYQDAGDATIYTRAGRKISPRSHTLHLQVSLTNVIRSTNIIVVVWVLQNKNVKKFDVLDATNTTLGANLLITGDSNQYQGFNGYTQDNMLPVNSSNYTVIKHMKFPLGKNTGGIQDDSTGGNQPVYSGGALTKHLTIKLPVPKVLTYEQDNGLIRTVAYPAGYAPFCVIGYYHADMSPPDEINQDVTFTARTNLWYDDA